MKAHSMNTMVWQQSGLSRFGGCFRLLASLSVLAMIIFTAACGSDNKQRLLELGDKMRAQGRFPEAVIFYRKAISKDAKYGEAYFRLGQTLLDQKRGAAALGSLRRASELLEGNSEVDRLLGGLYRQAYFSDPVRNKPLLGDLSSLSQRLLTKNRRSFEGLRMKGYVHQAKNEMPEAIEALELANQIQPGDIELTLALGQSYVMAQKIPNAEQLIQGALAKDKKVPQYYDFLYRVKGFQRQLDAAEEILKSKVDNIPDVATNYLELATHYYGMRKPEMMKATLERLVADRKKFPEARQMVGDHYARFGNFEEAVKQYRAGASEEKNQRLVFEKKIVELLSIQGKTAEATKEADELLKTHADDAELRALRATLRLQTGQGKDIELATNEFVSVLSKLPNNPVVRYNLGEAYLANKKWDEAEAQFIEAIALRTKAEGAQSARTRTGVIYPAATLALSRVYLNRKEFVKAKQNATDYLAVAPNDLRARMVRITANMGLKDDKAAREELEQILKLDPNNLDAIYVRARMDLTDKKFADAEAGFRLIRDKGRDDGFLGLVEVLMQTNRTDQALQLVEAEMQKDKNSVNLQLAYANLNVRMRRFDKAEVALEKLLEKQPKSELLLSLLAETYRYSGKLDEALQMLDRVSKLNPRNSGPLLEMANIYERTGRTEKLEALYRQILVVDSDSVIALNNLAFILAESGKDLDQALGYVQRAKQLEPNKDDIADTLGLVLIRKGLGDDAIKIFDGLLKKQPNHVTWRYHLALAFQMSGQRLKAKQELSVAIKNNPTDSEAKKIKELLAKIG